MRKNHKTYNPRQFISTFFLSFPFFFFCVESSVLKKVQVSLICISLSYSVPFSFQETHPVYFSFAAGQ